MGSYDENYVKQLEERCAALEEKMIDYDELQRHLEYLGVLLEFFIDSKCTEIRKRIQTDSLIAKPKNEEEHKAMSEHLGRQFMEGLPKFIKESPRIRYTGYEQSRDAIYKYIDEEFFR